MTQSDAVTFLEQTEVELDAFRLRCLGEQSRMLKRGQAMELEGWSSALAATDSLLSLISDNRQTLARRVEDPQLDQTDFSLGTVETASLDSIRKLFNELKLITGNLVSPYHREDKGR